ncbi:unnamed protein product [Protopolystoma xenopodis]|uniref:Uncharacterized protein n=1 Tax=Protopolystoma xenopodis TaxID=117903 RepID=A0A448WJ01_9PLAT|nr:unnamed protein product [Protopolystoma xenopodis]
MTKDVLPFRRNTADKVKRVTKAFSFHASEQSPLPEAPDQTTSVGQTLVGSGPILGRLSPSMSSVESPNGLPSCQRHSRRLIRQSSADCSTSREERMGNITSAHQHIRWPARQRAAATAMAVLEEEVVSVICSPIHSIVEELDKFGSFGAAS